MIVKANQDYKHIPLLTVKSKNGRKVKQHVSRGDVVNAELVSATYGKSKALFFDAGTVDIHINEELSLVAEGVGNEEIKLEQLPEYVRWELRKHPESPPGLPTGYTFDVKAIEKSGGRTIALDDGQDQENSLETQQANQGTIPVDSENDKRDEQPRGQMSEQVLELTILNRTISVVPGSSVGGEIRDILKQNGYSEQNYRKIHREHVKFEFADSVWTIEHIGSNPVTVNGNQLKPGETVTVSDGDTITLSEAVDMTVQI